MGLVTCLMSHLRNYLIRCGLILLSSHQPDYQPLTLPGEHKPNAAWSAGCKASLGAVPCPLVYPCFDLKHVQKPAGAIAFWPGHSLYKKGYHALHIVHRIEIARTCMVEADNDSALRKLSIKYSHSPHVAGKFATLVRILQKS
eukprot:TRINITY_DN48057_c0_g1_i1.p1 TRINITY_DN48057_c0_g1~~TRINITY_DN48057_c0_g1_i1.p1  ORF type:complete len:143 (+),score=1.21 TRINITY_DN48057_c0_g1_i1:213-641(+)